MATIPASDNEFPKVLLAEGAAAATPGTGLVVVYAKSDGKVYSKDDAGTETELAAASAALAAHLADTADAHDASAISFDPTGLAIIAGTEIQTALEELDAAVGAGGAPVGSAFVAYETDAGLSAERVVSTPTSGGAIPKLVRKTSDETVNNSAVLQDDNELLFAIAASEVWYFETNVWFDSGTTPDIKFAFTVPASAVLWWTSSGINAAGTAYNESPVVVTGGTAADQTATGAGTVRFVRHTGLVVNSTNAGNVTMQWAQNTQNSSDTKVRANSILLAWRLA